MFQYLRRQETKRTWRDTNQQQFNALTKALVYFDVQFLKCDEIHGVSNQINEHC